MSLDIRITPDYYEAYLDGERVGELEYRQNAGVVTALHTDVAPAAEGKGVGSALAQRFLDDARLRQDRVEPQCSFVRGWIAEHGDYADLVA